LPGHRSLREQMAAVGIEYGIDSGVAGRLAVKKQRHGVLAADPCDPGVAVTGGTEDRHFTVQTAWPTLPVDDDGIFAARCRLRIDHEVHMSAVAGKARRRRGQTVNGLIE